MRHNQCPSQSTLKSWHWLRDLLLWKLFPAGVTPSQTISILPSSWIPIRSALERDPLSELPWQHDDGWSSSRPRWGDTTVTLLIVPPFPASRSFSLSEKIRQKLPIKLVVFYAEYGIDRIMVVESKKNWSPSNIQEWNQFLGQTWAHLGNVEISLPTTKMPKNIIILLSLPYSWSSSSP